MGPAHHDRAGASAGARQGSLSDPPQFKIEAKLEYREDMESWIEVVAQRATVDRHYKGICSSLALIVIQSLPKSQQELVNSAVARGDIVKKHPSFQMQLRAVQQIVALIAVDTPLDVVGRVAQAFKEVSTCTRGRGESLKNFAVRFQGLAQVYLRISGATQSDPAGMVLALTFLENANLKPETRTQVQLQLSKGTEMDGVPLSERSFIWDNHTAVDEWLDAHGSDSDTSDSGDVLLSEQAREVKESAQLRVAQDKKFTVPDNLFAAPSGAPLPAMTIDDIFIVMNRMLDLSEKQDDFVSTKQLKTLMASWKEREGSSSAPGDRGAGSSSNPRGSSAGQKRPFSDRDGQTGRECFRCFSGNHFLRECPMLKVTCSHCNKRGHEEWLCYDKHNMHTSSPSDRKKSFLPCSRPHDGDVSKLKHGKAAMRRVSRRRTKSARGTTTVPTKRARFFGRGARGRKIPPGAKCESYS